MQSVRPQFSIKDSVGLFTVLVWQIKLLLLVWYHLKTDSTNSLILINPKKKQINIYYNITYSMFNTGI